MQRIVKDEEKERCETCILDDDKEKLLIAVYEMALYGHSGAIRLLCELLGYTPWKEKNDYGISQREQLKRILRGYEE